MNPDLPRGIRANLVLLGALIPFLIFTVVEATSQARLFIARYSLKKQECNSRVLRATCPEGQTCINNVCESIPHQSICQTRSAHGCSCPLGLETHLGECLAPHELKLVGGNCSTRGLRFSQELRRYCLDARALDSGSVRDCDEDVFSGDSMPESLFNLDLLHQRRSFLVHFDPQNPVTEDTLAEYQRQMSPHSPSLGDALAVLLIASPDNDESSELTKTRLHTVRQVVRSTVDDDNVEIWPVQLPQNYSINTMKTASKLMERGRQHLKQFPPVTWSPEVTQRLLTLLNPSQNTQILPQNYSNWLSQMFHNSVLVVPVYCDGTEYNPASRSRT